MSVYFDPTPGFGRASVWIAVAVALEHHWKVWKPGDGA